MLKRNHFRKEERWRVTKQFTGCEAGEDQDAVFWHLGISTECTQSILLQSDRDLTDDWPGKQQGGNILR